jgi:protein tyrosine phosphatase
MDELRRIIAIIVAVIFMLLGNIGCTHLEYVYVPDMNHIVDNIYLGNWTDSINWKVLEHEGITNILTLNKSRVHTEKELAEMKSKDISNIVICINDDEYSDISQHFDKCIEFIKSADKVLVHCSAGVSRSVSIVIAYLVREKKMSVDDALVFIRTKRKRANPNIGFMSQLYKL